ncbi:glycosyltransferase [Candidatus Micrarchaeota archaeon]|nr:glycosyltransferase [Candidatus Micrarchaeota archaeon]
MEISVVIPTLNRIEDLKECISALEKQDLSKEKFEIIVVDNGSTDGTRGFLKDKANAGMIRFLEEEKKGAGRARNLGVRNSGARFIAFTDDDCLPEAGWLSGLLKEFPSDGKCAGVGGPVITAHKDNVISRYCDYCRLWKDLDFRGRSIHLPTMNVLYRRTALVDIGIFEEGVIGVEDIHLSQKIIRKGYYLKNLDNAVVFHKDPRKLGPFYHRAWLMGVGIAIIGKRHGGKLEKDRITTIREILFPKRNLGKLTKIEKQPIGDRIMFGFLHRLWKLGVHNGYVHEMKKLHLQQIYSK